MFHKARGILTVLSRQKKQFLVGFLKHMTNCQLFDSFRQKFLFLTEWVDNIKDYNQSIQMQLYLQILRKRL